MSPNPNRPARSQEHRPPPADPVTVPAGPAGVRPTRGVLIALVVSMVLLCACGSAQTSRTSSSRPATAATTTSAAATQAAANGVPYAREQLAKYTGPATWTSPGPAFKTSAAHGETVVWADSYLAAPVNRVDEQSFAKAMAHVGVKVVACDGNNLASQEETCVSQAVARHYAGVAMNAIPPANVAPAVAAAHAAHMPVVAVNDGDPTAPTFANVSGLVAFPYSESGRLMADYAIASSNGHAHVLVLAEPIGTTSQRIVNAIKTEFAARCPGCSVTTQEVQVSQWATQLQPTTQAALERDPAISYVLPIYDVMASYILPALRQAGRSINVASMNSQLQPMQQLARGQYFKLDVGDDYPEEGYAVADQMLRLMTGNRPAGDEHVAFRVFTQANAAHLTLTQSADNSGVWFGSDAFVGDYERLWLTK